MSKTMSGTGLQFLVQSLLTLCLLAAFVQQILGQLTRVCTSSQEPNGPSQVSTTIAYAFFAFIAFMAFFGAAAAAFAAFLAILLSTGD